MAYLPMRFIFLHPLLFEATERSRMEDTLDAEKDKKVPARWVVLSMRDFVSTPPVYEQIIEGRRTVPKTVVC